MSWFQDHIFTKLGATHLGPWNHGESACMPRLELKQEFLQIRKLDVG